MVGEFVRELFRVPGFLGLFRLVDVKDFGVFGILVDGLLGLFDQIVARVFDDHHHRARVFAPPVAPIHRARIFWWILIGR